MLRSDLMIVFGNLPCYSFSVLVSVGIMMFLGNIVLLTTLTSALPFKKQAW